VPRDHNFAARFDLGDHRSELMLHGADAGALHV
jgi:hypothetical protein